MRISILLIFLFLNFNLQSQSELKYDSKSNNLPDWIQLMYSQNIDEGKIINAYENYYKKNNLVKNKHTQYYKRWLRNLSRETLEIQNIKSKNSNQWECIGPWDFDINAQSRSYAPGI